MTLDNCVQRLRKNLSNRFALSSTSFGSAPLVSMSGLSVSDPTVHSEICKVESFNGFKITDNSNTCSIKQCPKVGEVIAQRFQQVSSSRRKSISGLGLALSTSTNDFESLCSLEGNESEGTETDVIHK